MKKLLLFDIDGTLMNSGSAGPEAMAQALADLYQLEDGVAGISMSGKTDRLILQEVFERQGWSGVDEAWETYHERYLVRLRETVLAPQQGPRLTPGVIPLLNALVDRDDVGLGLLTGNVAEAARMKLEPFDLWRYFRFGAYGCDATDRNALVPIARTRARDEWGGEIPFERVIVIGDTPRDIECARVHGAGVVAVATGRYRFEELHAHQPDHCLTDMSDIDAVVQILTQERHISTQERHISTQERHNDC